MIAPQTVETLSPQTQCIRMRNGHAVLLGFLFALGIFLFSVLIWLIALIFGITIKAMG